MKSGYVALLGLVIAVLAAGTALADVESPVLYIAQFKQANSTDSQYAWLGQTMQNDLATAVRDEGMGRVADLATNSDSSPAGVLQAALDRDAATAVFGTYTTNGDQLDINAQVVEVASHKPLGALSATGSVNDLPTVEGKVVKQLHNAMGGATSGTAVASPAVQTPVTNTPNPVTNQQPTYTNPINNNNGCGGCGGCGGNCGEANNGGQSYVPAYAYNNNNNRNNAAATTAGQVAAATAGQTGQTGQHHHGSWYNTGTTGTGTKSHTTGTTGGKATPGASPSARSSSGAHRGVRGHR